jgi:hypothetical protein
MPATVTNPPQTPYYDRDGVTIYCGDARDVPLDGGPDKRVILTDPPYGVALGRKPNNQRFNRQTYQSYDDTADNLDHLIRDLWPKMQLATSRIVLTPGVANMWRWPKPDHVGAFYYPAATGCNSWGFSCWQPIFYYGKDPHGGTGSRPDSFISYESATPNGHPCPKPIGQWSRLFNRVATAR